VALEGTLDGLVSAAKQVDALLELLQKLNSDVSETEQLAETVATEKIQEAQLSARWHREQHAVGSHREQHSTRNVLGTTSATSTREPKDLAALKDLHEFLVREKKSHEALPGMSPERMLHDETLSVMSPERMFHYEASETTALSPEATGQDLQKGYRLHGETDNYDFLDLIEKEKRASPESFLTSESEEQKVDSEHKPVREAPLPSRTTMSCTSTSESLMPWAIPAMHTVMEHRHEIHPPTASYTSRSRHCELEPQVSSCAAGSPPKQKVPAEMTLKDEALHALALQNVSSAQHRATLQSQGHSIAEAMLSGRHFDPKPSGFPSMLSPQRFSPRIPKLQYSDRAPARRNIRHRPILPGPVSRQIQRPLLVESDPRERPPCVHTISPETCHEVLFNSPRLRSTIDVTLKRRRLNSRSKYFVRRPRCNDPKTVRSANASSGPAADQPIPRDIIIPRPSPLWCC